MQKQSVQTVDEKIFVIDREHAVISTSKVTTVTFKNGAEFTMPYAWRLFFSEKRWRLEDSTFTQQFFVKESENEMLQLNLYFSLTRLDIGFSEIICIFLRQKTEYKKSSHS